MLKSGGPVIEAWGPALFPLFRLLFQFSVVFSKACCILWFLHNPVKYLDNFSLIYVLHAFFYEQDFYKQHQAEIAKNQASVKQDHEAELLLFEDYSHSSSTLSSKNNRTYSTK